MCFGYITSLKWSQQICVRSRVNISSLKLSSLVNYYIIISIILYQFKYLGHIINNDFCDDDDIKREIRNLFMRTNITRNKAALVKATNAVRN